MSARDLRQGGRVASGEKARRGRPPRTSARELELIALRLFTERGFEDTTVEDISAEAGVSSRTFFRYFDAKSDVLWYQFDDEVTALREQFDTVPDRLALMDAIREVVLSVNRYTTEDIPELRRRIHLLSTAPALQTSSTRHYDAWERAVTEYAARRLDQPVDSLLPIAIGRATLAVCRAAYDLWLTRADADLTVYLAEAITALARGFAPGRGPQPTPDRAARSYSRRAVRAR